MSLAKSARASAVMNKVKGGDPHAFNRRFIGYNAITEGIVAQQRQADLKKQRGEHNGRFNQADQRQG